MNELEGLWEEAAPPDEPQFQDWYGKWSSIAGLDPDPDHPEHFYDYRSAFRAGAEPEQSEDGLYHWPSQYKTDDHPNRYVGNLDTKTGENLDELWDQAAPLQQDTPLEGYDPLMEPMFEADEDNEVSKIFGVIKGLGIEGIQGIGSLAMAAAGFSKQAQRNLAKSDFAEELERQYQARVERARKEGQPDPPREDLDAQKAQLREYSTNAQKSWLEAAEGLQAFTGSLPESEDVYGDDRPVAQYMEQAVKGFARFLPAMGVTALVPAAGLPLTYAQIFGESYREKVKQGIDDQVAYDAAVIEAAISTPLEFGGNILQLRFFKGAWNAFAKTSRLPAKVAAVLKSIVFGGLGEGIEEYLQQYPEELANIYAKHPDKSPEEIVEMARKVYGSEEFQAKAGKAGLMGATGGAILGVAGAGAGMLRSRGDIVQEQVDQVKRAIEAGMMSPADLKTWVDSLDEGPLREGLEAISTGGKAAGEQAQFAPAAEEDLQHLTTYLQEHLDEGTEVKVTAMGASEAAASVQRVGQVFGRKVIFFDAEGAANGFNGLYDQASDTIFVNSRAENPYITVVGHETLHALKTKAPDLYEQLSDIVVMSEGSQAWLDGLNEGRKAVGLEALKLEDALAQEEHLADFVGQQFNKEDFWRQLNEKNPTVAKSLADTVFKLLQKIREFLKGFKAPADPELVKNLEETQAALVAVFSEFATRETKVQDQTAVPVQPAKEKGILQKGLEAVGEAIGPSAAEAKMVTKATKAKARTTEITEEMWDQAERIEAEVQPTETQPEPTEEAPKAEAAKTPREEFDELWQTLDPEQKRRLADVPGDDEIDYPSKIQMVRAELATKRPERPKVERKDIAASVTTGERVTTLRGRIRAMGGINFLNFKGELKDMPSVKIALSRKGGEKIDLAEDILREEGWLAPEEKLLDVLRMPGAMRRGRVMREGEREKLPGYQTDQERRLQAEMGWEAEAPPEGNYVQMRAQDLPEGKQLVILDGKSARGWDVYQVVEKDAFGVTLRDGETVNLGPNDLVEVVEPAKAAELKASVKTESDEFKKWFGGSKVTDKDGKPLQVYHATFNEFDQFKRRRSDIGIHFGTAGQAEDRFEFKRKKDQAKVQEEGARTLPVYLRIENPLRLRDVGWFDYDNLHRAISNLPEFKDFDPRRHRTLARLRDLIESKGYDGIVYRNTGEVSGSAALYFKWREEWDKIPRKYASQISVEEQKHPQHAQAEEAYKAYSDYTEKNAEDSYVVFRPEQIKSAFNVGTFDLRSKNILASTRRGPGHVAISNQAAWIAENRNRMLPEIEVEVSAIDETGKSYKIKDKADIALKELDRQKSFAERLLECLKS